MAQIINLASDWKTGGTKYRYIVHPSLPKLRLCPYSGMFFEELLFNIDNLKKKNYGSDLYQFYITGTCNNNTIHAWKMINFRESCIIL